MDDAFAAQRLATRNSHAALENHGNVLELWLHYKFIDMIKSLWEIEKLDKLIVQDLKTMLKLRCQMFSYELSVMARL